MPTQVSMRVSWLREFKISSIILHLLDMLASILIFEACDWKEEPGKLTVRAPNSGHYEIYRVESEEPLQFVSEQIGQFNNPLELDPGYYLILADCSYETIVIRPGGNQSLTAHQVIFNPPLSPSPDDNFSIQCNRFAKTKSRQNLQNRYSLNILHGTRDLLVGMVPLQIKFPNSDGNSTPQVLSFNLSGVQVAAYSGMKPKTSFFISPTEGLLSITQNQEFGHWLFLMAGRYKVEVNGTHLDVNLSEGQQNLIQPGFLRVTVPETVDITAPSNILGSPLYVELNDGHWLDLNETYAILPGEAELKLNGSLYSHKVLLSPQALTEKIVRSVIAELDCPPWDWACLGSREVYLYESGKPYPFAEGITDVPLLFFEEDAWVSVQGSRDIRYKIPDRAQETTLKVGFVKFVPKRQYRPGQLTDLSRVEGSGFPIAGHSLDLPVDGDTLMPLIVGRYNLTQFHAFATADWERHSSRNSFTVSSKETTEIPYTVYVSEKKIRQIQEVETKKQQLELENNYKLTRWKFRPIAPVKAL